MADFPSVTPADSPSDPSGFASVAVQPMNIQAPMDDLQGAYDSAGALSAAGVSAYASQSPRQAAAEALLKSPPGYQDFDIYGGFSGQGETTHGWPNDVGPADGDADTPDQGSGDFQGTT